MECVCERCVAAYCSCAAGFSRGSPLQARGESKIPENACAVHSACSFCCRPLKNTNNRLLGPPGRAVKRKYARVNDGSALINGPLGDGVMVEALVAERNALCVELEEERSAAAVAATETLAMITRLQEEKAAVQMEASQYKRMVEERRRYDEEAIGMLNEILARQEEEKLAMSREIEMYKSSIAGRSFKYPASSEDDEYMTPVESRNLMDSFAAAAAAAAAGDESLKTKPRRQVEGDELRMHGVGLDEFSLKTTPKRRAEVDEGHKFDEFSREGLTRQVDDGASTTPGPKFEGGYERNRSACSTGRSEVVPDSEELFMQKYWRNSRSAASRDLRRAYDRLGKSDEGSSGGSGLFEEERRVRRNDELLELSRRLHALEAERGFLKHGGRSEDLEILEEISRQIQALDRKSDDGKELSEASFVFSFKGVFSFNGLRKSLNSNLNRLACMFIKHTEATGMNYGDHHHVGLSHLLENSRKSPRGVPLITRGLKCESSPPQLLNSHTIHRQNVHWPMDARGRSETAFGGWDY